MKEQNFTELRKSPLFNLSLASKELFHSNFWAWLLETPPDQSPSGIDYMKVFFPDYKSGPIVVRREKWNMDLVIEVQGEGIYVIENKVKSAPRSDQLEKYNQKLEKTVVARKLLTSIIPPDFIPEKYGWSHISFHDIAEKLKIIGRKENGYRRSLIVDYQNFVFRMIEGIQPEVYPSSEVPYLDFFGAIKRHKQLQDLRIYDLYTKQKGSLLKNYLADSLKDAPFKIHLEEPGVEFNNGNFTCNFYFKRDSILFGIQIQGLQYRYFYQNDNLAGEFKRWISSSKKLECLPNQVKILLDAGWFQKEPKSIYQTSMRNQFCFYKPSFIYQYKRMDQITEPLMFSDLSRWLQEDLQKAWALLTRIS